MAQTCAILRYLGSVHKGRNGEDLYPGLRNPDLSYEIDEMMDKNGDRFLKWMNFFLPLMPEYKNKDEHFLTWITKTMPQWMEELEAGIVKNKGKYLLGSKITIADIQTYSVFFKLATNEKFEHNLII